MLFSGKQRAFKRRRLAFQVGNVLVLALAENALSIAILLGTPARTEGARHACLPPRADESCLLRCEVLVLLRGRACDRWWRWRHAALITLNT